MYLSDRDIKWAIETGKLICVPPPANIDASSIDLHLDKVAEAKIWDVQKFTTHEAGAGRRRPELYIGRYNLGVFSRSYLCEPPAYENADEQLVGRRGNQIIAKPGAFLLWQTKEIVGTPDDRHSDLICFVNGKSTKARAGIVVHLTAPNLHVTWSGHITLEIANLGPFDLVLEEDDVIAQLVVARVTSAPEKGVSATSATLGQSTVHGRVTGDGGS